VNSATSCLHRIFEYPRDPSDEPYIDLAAACAADYLVTRDRDLLSLASDHSIFAKQFRQRFPTLRVMDVENFLGAVESHTRP
jgi:predicted nucleic acid-binding protein